jgi:hypothetical protein
MTAKARRKCKSCDKWYHLTPSKLKRWSGYCNSECRDIAKHNNPIWLRNECDVMFSRLVREKRYCEKCGRNDIKLDCAHIIPRGNKTLRWDLINALCLCHRCHRFWAHMNPIDFTEWYKTKYPKRYIYLLKYKNIFTKRTLSDYQKLYKNLKEKNIAKLLTGKLSLDKQPR